MFVLALDAAWFLPPKEFRSKVDQLTAYMKTSRPMPGGEPVHIPGERSRQQEARGRPEGIVLTEQAWATVAGVLQELGLAAELPEG